MVCLNRQVNWKMQLVIDLHGKPNSRNMKFIKLVTKVINQGIEKLTDTMNLNSKLG
jgi:hypothetical protein